MERARRLALGQWFTPTSVVDLALALVLPAASFRARCRVLDPACGDGAFLRGALRAGVPAVGLSGIDVDGEAAAACKDKIPGAAIHCGNVFASSTAGGNYDAVVGNPPYVRHERMEASHKQLVLERLRGDWPELESADVDAIAGRGDLAAAFVLQSMRLVRPGGRVALVVSGAMLDAGYAAALWRSVATAGRVVAIVDAPNERWFEDAAVNTVILVLERNHRDRHEPAVEPVRIARLLQPTELAAERVSSLADLERVAHVRHADPSQPARWSVLMRASNTWLELEAAAAHALVPLGELAVIKRGVTSGANDVFYMTRTEAAHRGIESQVLRPLVRSPRARGAQRIAIDPATTSQVAVVCPAGDDTLGRFPGARRYFHGHRDAATRPTLRARPYWWSLPIAPAQLFLTKAYAARFVQRVSPVPVVADQRVYSVVPTPGVDVWVLAAVLNSTFTALALESCGRASLGEGALEWTVADARTLPVIDPRGADVDTVRALTAALAPLLEREIGSVGFERTQPDRLALDAAVSRLLDPGVPSVRDVHGALVEAVERRTARAQCAISG